MEVNSENFSENRSKTEGPSRGRGSLGFEYEAQVQVIKQKHGDLEVIRHRLGLSKRKVAQILMVDPSAWTRWTKHGEDAPPHIYRALEWYLILQDKYPGMDSPFWLEAVARPSSIKAEADALRRELGSGVERLDSQILKFQKKLKWTQMWLGGTVAASLLTIVLLSCSTTPKSPNFIPNTALHEVPIPDKEIRTLAEKFAPIFIHEVGPDPSGDVFTNVDFDNDWVGDNNWKDQEKFELNPSIYYEVTSTASHYFITYGVYHPRDYSWVCLPILCHENDMEGVIVVVDRKNMKWVYSESIAHNFIHAQANTHLQERPTLMIEWGGHGIYPPDEYSTSRPTKVFNPQIYALEPIAKLWNLQFREKNLYEGTFDYEGGRFKLSGVPIAFLGRAWTNNKANPPWAWTDWKQGPRGNIFFDPAEYISKKHPELQMSMVYERHPYLMTLPEGTRASTAAFN